MRLRRHPSRHDLRQWLAGDDLPPVDAHVGSCAHCAERLEQLAEEQAGATAPDPALRNALEAALAAPEDLQERLAVQVQERQRQVSLRDLMLDAVGGGLDTLRLLISEEDDVG